MKTLSADSDVVSFEGLTPDGQARAGGKGGTLARLKQANYPVPPGFVVLPSAFDGDEPHARAWAQVEHHLACLRGGGEAGSRFAVRSSALAEDSAAASFAGEFETVLNVESDQEIKDAILTVRKSRNSARVQAYSEARGIKGDHEIAVVVQQMIEAEISGVLFTADPITGGRAQMSGAFVHGLGEKLVSGETDAQGFTFRRPRGGYAGPADLEHLARKLYKVAVRLEKELNGPQDIEWASAGGKLYILQARPITSMLGHDPATGDWNDTRTGDFLWSSVNFGEAVTEPMTPLAWSVLQFTLDDWRFLSAFPNTGSIAGYPYINISIFASLYKALGRGRSDLIKALEGTLYMPLPDEMEIPVIRLSVRDLFAGLANFLRVQTRQRGGLRRLPAYLATNAHWFKRIRERLQAETSRTGLVNLWQSEIAPHVLGGVWTVLGTATHSADYTMNLRRRLTVLAGPEETDLLLASLSDDVDLLPSLGPVAGLARIARGDMDREDYMLAYGHRGPHEFEISKPRPVEDPSWLDRQLAQFRDSPVDVDALIEEQRSRSRAARERLLAQGPRKSRSLLRQLAESARRARLREKARSEYVRDRWMVRLFALRVGELTGLGEEVFFLSLKELFAILKGQEADFDTIAARQEVYRRCLALPPFPSIIRGRFDPFQWAADPQRRSDIFDASAPLPAETPSEGTRLLKGAPGSAGRVEGVVRVLEHAGDGDQFRQGEILVTTQTDVSWTLLFPRAAAVITDVGAPLSHAAIVARELGVPAVVGCGDATMHLRTGDRVRVDGGRGIIEVLEPA